MLRRQARPVQRPSNSPASPRRDRILDAVFLDRDGTINVERADYVKSVDEFVLLTGALDALVKLAAFAVPIIVITNQSVIGRGIVSQKQIDEVHEHLQGLVRTAGGRIDAIYLCPHRPDDGCDCRKPKPGLLQAAAADLRLDLGRCILIGDSVTDLQAAYAAGSHPLMVRTGRQARQLAQLAEVDPDVMVMDDLAAAVEWMTQRLAAGVGVCESAAPARSVASGS